MLVNLSDRTVLSAPIITAAHEYYSPTKITTSWFPPPTPSYVPTQYLPFRNISTYSFKKTIHLHQHTIPHSSLRTFSPRTKKNKNHSFSPTRLFYYRQLPVHITRTQPDNWTTIPQFLIFKIKVLNTPTDTPPPTNFRSPAMSTPPS